MLMLGAALFYLIYILTSDFAVIRLHMEKMSGHMEAIENSFTEVTGDIDQMRASLDSMNGNVTVLPAMSASVTEWTPVWCRSAVTWVRWLTRSMP